MVPTCVLWSEYPETTGTQSYPRHSRRRRPKGAALRPEMIRGQGRARDSSPAVSGRSARKSPLYLVDGDEHMDNYIDGPKGVYIRTRVPREPGKGLYVAEQEVKDVDIFRLVQRPGCDSCTDAVRDFILANEFTNVDFFEIGETF
jgi:hypothetical protein